MAEYPGWVLELRDEILDCLVGFTFFEMRYSPPDGNDYESHLIEIAPVKLEIAEAGENDGEEIFDSNFDVNLLELNRLFNRVDYFHSEPDYETLSRTFTVGAMYRRRKVFLIIRTVPFEDAEIVGRIRQGGKFEFFKDLNFGD